MSIEHRARVNTRALAGATLVGATLGALLGAAYLAGGAARTASAHARTASLAAAAAGGFSEAALQAEEASMSPGALALAQRADPAIAEAAGWRARPSLTLAGGPAASDPAASQRFVLRASLPRPVAPALAFHLPPATTLQGARELGCLTDAVYYEARGESLAGQAAVAQVVLNRVRRGGYPKSICGVVYQGAQSHVCQFSFVCDGAMHRPRETAAWRRSQSVAARALGGFVMAEVGDATHFHVARLGQIWGVGLVRVAQVGAHVFYRLTAHGGFIEHAIHKDAPDDDAIDAPADGGDQPNLILASAVTIKPAETAVSAVAAAAPAAASVVKAVQTDKPEKAPAATGAPAATETKANSLG